VIQSNGKKKEEKRAVCKRGGSPKKNEKQYCHTQSSTLPLSKHTPPSTAISEHKTTPRALLSDLDDRLPSRRQPGVRLFYSSVAVLLLARQANDFLAGALDRQLGRLLLCSGHGTRVGIVRAAL
jgi:hypothetical protein